MKKILGILVICSIGFGYALYINAPSFSFSKLNQNTKVADNKVRTIQPTYTNIPGDPVRGRADGKVISEFGLGGNILIFCPITDGAVYENQNTQILNCNKNAAKEVIIATDNTFSITLYSGSYFVDTQTINKTLDTHLPTKINIHKGQTATFSILIDQK